VNAAGDGERLPSSIGGVVDLALEAFLERAPLFALLALGMFVVCAAVEFPWVAANDDAAAIRSLVGELIEVVLMAFIVAAIAQSITGRLAGDRPTTRALLRAALVRWPNVAIAMVLVQCVVVITGPSGGLEGSVNDPVTLLLAPVVWLFWGALSLAGPLTALGADRGLLGSLTGIVRSLVFGFRAVNLPRMALVALATVAPTLLEDVLYDAAFHHRVAHASFWSGVPLDALTVGPLAALQTAFALDFARRATSLNRPR
jgi:hypothetical protein